MTKKNLNKNTYIFSMIKLQSRAIKVALMLQGDINTQMSKGVKRTDFFQNHEGFGNISAVLGFIQHVVIGIFFDFRFFRE